MRPLKMDKNKLFQKLFEAYTKVYFPTKSKQQCQSDVISKWSEIKNDDDILKSCVMRSKKQNGLLAVPSPTSKQNFDINLTCNKKTTVLQFSIRTNKPGVDHKLGQGANLAVKFNGVV